MPNRIRIPLLAALAATVAAAAPLAAQDYLLPDSLAYRGLPKDPRDFVRLAAEIESLYGLGCISSGDAYSREAFRVIFAAAETDMEVRKLLLDAASQRVRIFNAGHGDLGCPGDPATFEAWMIDNVRRKLPGDEGGISLFAGSRSPEVHELMVEIALDPRVREAARGRAAGNLVVFHAGKYPLYNSGGSLLTPAVSPKREPGADFCLWLDALEAVLAEYGDRPPDVWRGQSEEIVYRFGRRSAEWAKENFGYVPKDHPPPNPCP